MRSNKYTKSELWVKDELERLFWIEIAKRKALQASGDVFRLMLALSHEVSAWLDSNGAALSEPLEDGVDLFWDAIQFGSYNVLFARPEGHLELVDMALSLFDERGRDVAQRLPCYHGFRLADFSVVSDLVDLHGWWMFINSGEGRKYLNSKGLFSSTGELHPVVVTEEQRFTGHERETVLVSKEISGISTMLNPVRIPRRVTKEKIRSWTTDEHEVVVNGHILSNRLLLDFDLSKPMPTMREVELALRVAFSSARSEQAAFMLASGIITDPSLFELDEMRPGDMTRLLVTSPEEHQLMLAQNSARPLIFGLYGWDLMYSGLSKTEAANRALKDLRPSTGHQEDYSVRRALYGIKAVQKRIDRYDPTSLPWNC